MDLFDNSMKAKGHYLPMAMMTSIGSHHCGVLLRGIVQLPGFDCELRVAASMTNLYCGHCFPVEITSYCVWLYYTVSLSFYDIEAMMLYRGITVTYEAIRGWCLKFVQGYANQVRSMSVGSMPHA